MIALNTQRVVERVHRDTKLHNIRTERRHRRRRLRLADPSSAATWVASSGPSGHRPSNVHAMTYAWRRYRCSSSATSRDRLRDITREILHNYRKQKRWLRSGGRCYFNWCLVVCFIDGMKFSVPSCVQYSKCKRYRTAILSNCVPAPQSSFIAAKAANTLHTDTPMQ